MNKSGYIMIPVAWLIISFVACLISATHEGVDSIIPNFIKYGLGAGSVIAVLMALAYWYDYRKLKGND